MKKMIHQCNPLTIAKNLTAMATLCLLFAIPFNGFGQYTIVDDQFYSNSLGADNMVDVWLPPGYFDNPRLNYPVVYLLHSAVDHTGSVNNQNGYEDFLPILNQMTALGEIDPFIVVKPNGWAPPYAGSCWYNSALYGAFEDMVRVDLINYIESNYRALKGQDYRYVMGHSMGGHAGWSMSIRYPDLFGAVADIAGYKHMDLTVELMTPIFLAESGGAPPYSYSPANGQLSALVFTLLGAYNANMLNPPFYVNVFLDDNGDIIPSYYADFLADDIYQMIPTSTKPSNTLYWIAQSATDPIVPWPTITQFTALLDQNNWDYTFFSFDGGHFLVNTPMAEAFRFIDGVWKTKNPPLDYSLLFEDLEFQPGVTIDINVNVYVNENAVNWANHGKVFAIEGMAHTANCWKPFAEELFLYGQHGKRYNEFFAIDMPGRGGSGFPEGWNNMSNDVFKLADMYLEDYIAVIRATIHRLIEDYGIQPNTIMGHSLGGLEVILFQDMLIQEGTNLRNELGIKNAILLAPAIPAPLTWSFLGAGAGQLIPFAWESPDHGWILDIPYTNWPWLFFTNTCCYFPPGNPYGYPPEMVPGAPDAAAVLANGYNSIEAGPLLFHMAGLPVSMLDPETHHPDRPRVSANEGIFARQHGVKLTIIADQYDKMMTPAEELALYEYLTGDFNQRMFFEILGEETCHDTHISDPHAILAMLNKPYFKDAIADETVQNDELLTMYPNPSQGESTFSFKLPEQGHVTLKLYNVCGELTGSLINDFMPAGEHQMTYSTRNMKSGIYFLKLNAGTCQHTAKLIVK